MIGHLFNKGYKEVIAGAFKHNIASINGLQKCGMKPMAKKERITYHNNIYECVYVATFRP